MQTERLKVTGMTCGGSVSKVTSALKKIDGVGEVDVSLSAGEATVQYNEALTSPDALSSAVSRAGYGSSKGVENQTSSGGCCS